MLSSEYLGFQRSAYESQKLTSFFFWSKSCNPYLPLLLSLQALDSMSQYDPQNGSLRRNFGMLHSRLITLTTNCGRNKKSVAWPVA